MTKEKAIEQLKNLLECNYVDTFEDEENEALEMAISALSENCFNEMKDEEFINNVRDWLVQNIFRNGFIMHNQTVRDIDGVDLAEVIAGLYEIIHMMQFNEKYDYMFHWANKCGSWVDSDFFLEMFLEKESEE